MPRQHAHPRLPARTGAALVTVDGRTYPLESARLVARAEGGLALTTLVQEFHNPWQEPLEVTYTLPLPADGGVIGYTIRIGERVIRGEIEKREEAKDAYLRALAAGRSAGLLEQDRADTFTQRLGSLPPGQAAAVEIEVLHPLGFVPADGADPARWEYRFQTVVGVRYEGEAGRVPDAERLDVDRAGEGEIPARIELDLTVADGSPEAMGVTSTTHDIRCTGGDGLTRVGLQSGARLDRDIVVRWNACAAGVGVRLVQGSGRPGDDGRYGLLTLTPPAVSAAALTRDVTVLIDASGSMSGPPLDLAKRVVHGLLASLGADDRLEMIAFDSAPTRLWPGLKKATHENLRAAARALDAIEAGGATEMEAALIEALAPLREGSQRQVVLVTDGQIGFEARVVGGILRRLPANARVHTVGVGAAPNRSLTRAVARAGRGVEVFAADEGSADEAARRLCRATVRPLLTEVTVGGEAVLGSAPRRPADVLAGQPLVLALELKPEGGTVELSTREAGTADAWIWRIVLPADGSDTGPSPEVSTITRTSLPLGALFGRERIADLELEATVTSDDGPRLDSLVDSQIEEAALRHRITSRMTSLVAVAEEPSVDPRLPRRRERLPVELPAGVSAEGSGLLGGGRAVLYRRLPGTFGGAFSAHETQALELARLSFMSIRAAMAGPARPVPPIASRIPPTQVRIAGGRLLRATPDAVTVEFETPFNGFAIPQGEVNLWLDGVTWRVARVVPGESSPRGPHPVGLVVRLALSIEGHPEWIRAASIELRWLSGPGDEPRQLILGLALPAEAPRPRSTVE